MGLAIEAAYYDAMLALLMLTALCAGIALFADSLRRKKE